MRSRFVWRVAAKELLSTFRDRRTLTSAILLPLVFIPLFSVGFPLLLARTFGGEQQKRQQVGVVGTLPAGLRARLISDEKDAQGKVQRAGVELVPVADPLKAVQAGRVQAALEVQGALPSRAGAGSGSLKLYSKSSDQRAQAGAAQKVRDAARAYSASLVARELRRLRLDESFLTPVRTVSVDAASSQERSSGVLGFIIPYFILQFTLAGAMATAIDSTAGEKERGTLEVLLVSPVRRAEVVLGKLLATTAFAVLSATLGVIGFTLSGPLAGLALPRDQLQQALQGVLGGTLSVSAPDVLVLLAVALGAALLISALLISIAVFARSFKEAQTYLAPIAIVLIVPMLVVQFADFIARGAALYAVPLVNVALVILDLIKGALVPGHAALTIVTNLGYTALLALLALRSFSRENVIFRN